MQIGLLNFVLRIFRYINEAFTETKNLFFGQETGLLGGHDCYNWIEFELTLLYSLDFRSIVGSRAAGEKPL